MTTELTLAELEASGERELGVSAWERIDQEQITRFAEATHDRQWIHVVSQVLRVSDARMGINYGTERIRFTAPVPVGSEVRLNARLLSSERRGEGVLYRVGVEVEIRDGEKPALVGEVVYLAF